MPETSKFPDTSKSLSMLRFPHISWVSLLSSKVTCPPTSNTVDVLVLIVLFDPIVSLLKLPPVESVGITTFSQFNVSILHVPYIFVKL